MYIYGDQNFNMPNHLNFGKYMLDHLRAVKSDNVCLENGLTYDKLTYKEANQYAVNLAVALLKLGVRRGDVVAFGSDDFLNYIPTALAVVFTGAAYTTFEDNIGKAVLKHKLNLVKPKYFICSLPFWESYNDLLKSYDCIETFIAIDDIPNIKLSLKTLVASEDVDVDTFEPVTVEGKTDTALILYSSGTTGMPKGVQITHSGCIVTSLPHAFSKLPSLRTAFMANTLGVNYYTFKTFKFLLLGRKVVYSSNFSAKIALQILRDCEVDVIFSTQVYIVYVLNSLSTDNYFDSVKMIYLLRFHFQKLKSVIQGYGLCECGEPMSELWGEYKPGSVGLASPGIIAKVVDIKTRAILGPNQPGEICIKGPSIMKGYIDIERTNYLDEEGFYLSGDLGYYDEEKYFYLIDRLTDVINYRGVKISPVQVENILLEHPAVLDVGVIGRPVPVVEEVPMAFVVKKPGADVSEDELKKFVSDQVTAYMELQGGIMFIAKIPRNSRGKTLRRKLKEILNENLHLMSPVPDFSELRC
ncbi:luciferin 4-monooxygenase-like [Choristoneura fumiferana]|uniref:luciferin 4-monooxygenase-like n=1 Tax=Choristoneura fumiferana TaxID=7141 RepID=UPI003D15C670